MVKKDVSAYSQMKTNAVWDKQNQYANEYDMITEAGNFAMEFDWDISAGNVSEGEAGKGLFVKTGHEYIKFLPNGAWAFSITVSGSQNWDQYELGTVSTSTYDYDVTTDGNGNRTYTKKTVYIEKTGTNLRVAIKNATESNYYSFWDFTVNTANNWETSTIGFAQSKVVTPISNLNVWMAEKPVDKDNGEPYMMKKGDFLAKSSSHMIVYPHFGTPVFTETNSSFNVEIATESGLDNTKWKAYLMNDYISIPCAVTNASYGKIYLDTKDGYNLTVSVPQAVPHELMNLVISHEDIEVDFKSPQSVNVVEELDEDFYAYGISDTHLNSWKKSNGSPSRGDNVAKLNKQLRLGGARYLYHGGDISLTSTEDRTASILNNFVQAFEDEKIPLIIVAGNHEYDLYSDNQNNLTPGSTTDTLSNFTFDTFDRLYGMRSALITMGDDMVIAKHDYGAFGYWTANDEENAKEHVTTGPIGLRDALFTKWQNWNDGNSDKGFRLLFQHVWNSGREDIDFDNASTSNVYADGAFLAPDYHRQELTADGITPVEYDLQATGHVHATYAADDNILAFGGTGHDASDWTGEGVMFGYEYDAANSKKWICDVNEKLRADELKGVYYNSKTATEEQKANILRYQSDFIIDECNDEPVLYEDFAVTNNGTATWNVANITNKADFNFYNGFVQFVMAEGEYEVSGGTIIDRYDTYDGNTIVNVRVNIPAGSIEEPAEIAVAIQSTTSPAEQIFILAGAETEYISAETDYVDIISNTDILSDAVTMKKDGNEFNGFTVTEQNKQVLRVLFNSNLVSQSNYTISLGDKLVGRFEVLPANYTDKEVYRGGGKLVGYIPAEQRSVAFDNSPLESFVYDITHRFQTPNSDSKTYNTSDTFGRVTLTFKTDDGYEYTFYNANTSKDTSEWHLAVSGTKTVTDHVISAAEGAVLDNCLTYDPLNKLVPDATYNFRVIRLGKSLSLYAKRTTDKYFDRLFTYNNLETDAPGYTSLSLKTSGTQSDVINDVRLYEIPSDTSTPSVNVVTNIVAGKGFVYNVTITNYNEAWFYNLLFKDTGANKQENGGHLKFSDIETNDVVVDVILNTLRENVTLTVTPVEND